MHDIFGRSRAVRSYPGAEPGGQSDGVAWVTVKRRKHKSVDISKFPR